MRLVLVLQHSIGASLLAAVMLWAPAASTAAADKPEYKVGDRLPQKPGAGASSSYKELDWDALVPADWNPARELAALDLGRLSDSDPRAMKALEQMRKAWDNAPVVEALNGSRVRLPGFMVPLDNARGQVTEFLLVPYFGACIHTPPPPANQIVHVFPTKPFKADQMMEAVWVSGVLETTRSETGLGSAGYRMKGEVITPYRK
jgi:hypothetical protein